MKKFTAQGYSRVNRSGGGSRVLENRPRDRLWLFTGVLIYLAVGVTGLFVSLSSQQMRNLFTTLQHNQTENDQLLGEYSRLLLERGAFSSYQNVGRVAERELSMKFPEVARDLKRVER